MLPNFLQASSHVVQRSAQPPRDSPNVLIWHALILTTACSALEQCWASCRAQALDLLKRGWPPGDSARYDPDHALVLCRMHAFTPGLLFLYEQLRLFREVLHVRSHMGFQPTRKAGLLFSSSAVRRVHTSIPGLLFVYEQLCLLQEDRAHAPHCWCS